MHFSHALHLNFGKYDQKGQFLKLMMIYVCIHIYIYINISTSNRVEKMFFKRIERGIETQKGGIETRLPVQAGHRHCI